MRLTAARRDIFVCYSTADSEECDRLCSQLKLAGLEPWVDKKALRSGRKRWPDQAKAIDQCPVFLILRSQSLVHSENCLEEMQEAVRVKPEEGAILVLTLDGEPFSDSTPDRIKDLTVHNIAKGFGGYFESIEQVVHAAREHIPERQPRLFGGPHSPAGVNAKAVIDKVSPRMVMPVILALVASAIGWRTASPSPEDPIWCEVVVPDPIDLLPSLLVLVDLETGEAVRWEWGASGPNERKGRYQLSQSWVDGFRGGGQSFDALDEGRTYKMLLLHNDGQKLRFWEDRECLDSVISRMSEVPRSLHGHLRSMLFVCFWSMLEAALIFVRDQEVGWRHKSLVRPPLAVFPPEGGAVLAEFSGEIILSE